jgi:23S rRNA pseudouridine2605 synthase
LRRIERNAHCPVIMVHDPHRTQPAAAGQDPAAESGERVAKALARAGVASRREVERLIEAGRVALNGEVLTTPAVKVEPGDVLTVDGEVVNEPEPARLFRYHKPVGLVTTHKDPQGRPTVFDALPGGLPRLISVGRLDLNTEGLLLLTNDGGLARELELPQTALVRRYRARAHGRITQERLDKLKHGVTVEGVRYGAIEASLDKAKEGAHGANVWITLTLSEGKNREVRRVLESLGLKVNRLIRLAYGPFALGTLGVGEVEEVGPRVIREQLGAHIAPENLPKGNRAQWKAPPATAAGRREPASPLRGRGEGEGGVGADTGQHRAGRPASKASHAPPPPAPARKGEGRRAADPDRNPRPHRDEGKKEYKPGWAKPKRKAKPGAAKPGAAKPKATGSRPAAGPSAGPRGPRPSASPPRSSPARRPGPRGGGGRGRRG